MRIGIPDLDRFNPKRGIGRHVTTIVAYWQHAGQEIVPLVSRRTGLALLRNLNWGLIGSLSDVDVVFIPHVVGAESLLFLPKSVPTVTIIHDIGGVDCPEDRTESTLLTGPLLRLALRAACRSSRVVTISDFTKQRLLNYSACFAHKTSTVYLGVDHDVLFQRDRLRSRAFLRDRDLPISDRDFVVICVGAEYARKNLVTLIDALALLRSRVPSVRLVKVGSSHGTNNRDVISRRMRQQGLAAGSDVVFVEDVDDTILSYLYCGADVYVSTSKYEGFGLPLLEAMACGLPCVVSNAGALPEVGGDAALYVDPDDSAGFADRIEEVARCQHGYLVERALARATEFSWEKTSQTTLAILTAAMERGTAVWD
jgi:glycosyltransferase involved in cell wall biosynthesis